MRVSCTVLFVALALGLFGSAAARAERATDQEMERVCRNWLSFMVDQRGSWAGRRDPEIVGVQDLVSGDMLLARCFSIAPRGCVVVPVLRELPPVKAYSEDSDLDVGETTGVAQLLRDVLEDRINVFVRRYGSIEASQADGDKLPFDRVNRREWERFTVTPEELGDDLASGALGLRGEVGPLLTTDWHQGWPYNLDCPMGDGGRSAAGCMATAAVQVMRYHEWPPNGIGDHSYYWNGDQSCGGDVGGGTLYADFSDAYDWANMPDDCGGGCTTAQQEALSELSYEVGVSFNMNYGYCGSGANFDAPLYAFPAYFDYAASIHREDRYDYTATSWFYLIVAEISAGRPMMYTLIMPGAGHAIVCDGWRDTGGQNQYHMNYGWGGTWTGWYTIDNLPDTVDPMAESLIMDIFPADHLTPDPDPMTFDIPPHATTAGIAMEASPATDVDSPPCQYQFLCDSGGSGCDDTGWKTGRTYEDTGLLPNTQYSYSVVARDNADPNNLTTPSASRSAYTYAAIPGAPTLGNETSSSMDITVDPNGNPSYTDIVIYCMSSPDPSWQYKYVSAAGTPSGTATWQTADEWGAVTAGGMQSGTQYCFIVGARNEDLCETVGGPQTCSTTLAVSGAILSAGSCRDHGGTEHCLDVTAGSPGDNVEPRLGGIEKLEFLMDSVMSTVTASASCSPTGYGGVVTPIADGTATVVVGFGPGLPDGDCCEITLGGDADDSAFVSILTSDVDRDATVSTADNSSVKSRLGSVVDGSNFQYDVDADGSISTADNSSVKSRLGNVAPSCP
ncbi:MAG TPA: C10 family peptidase [Phycisphaerae bacterium]|nr:C10 family peptidase [Phycisphaerae bacterium]